MASPLIEPAETGERIRPIYPQTEGLTSRMIEAAVAQALTLLDKELDNDPLPFALRQEHTLCGAAVRRGKYPFPHRAGGAGPGAQAAGIRGAAAAPIGAAASQGAHPGGNRAR